MSELKSASVFGINTDYPVLNQKGLTPNILNVRCQPQVYLSMHANHAQGFEHISDEQIAASVRLLNPESEEQASLLPDDATIERHDYRAEGGDYFVIISGKALAGDAMTHDNLSTQLQETHQPLVSNEGVAHVCGIDTGNVSLSEQTLEGELCSGIASHIAEEAELRTR